MALEPPPHNNNRFAILNDKPQPKRAKRNADVTQQFFPALPQPTQQENPKYIIISSNEEGKPLSNFSCFTLHRAIKNISKEIIKIQELKDGNLLVLVKNQTIADKFIKSKELIGLCKIICTLHATLNYTKGTIYAPYLIKVEEEEIIKELKDEGVVGAYKFQSYKDNKLAPNGIILLTFDRFHTPNKINICWHSVKVREYVPNPMRCKNCQRLGHTTKRCNKPASCVNCNQPPHTPTPCTRISCANCLENHPSSSNRCPKYIQQKEILAIQTKNKCTLSEARRAHSQLHPPTSNTTSYAEITANNTNNINMPAKEHPTTTTQSNKNNNPQQINTNTNENPITPQVNDQTTNNEKESKEATNIHHISNTKTIANKTYLNSISSASPTNRLNSTNNINTPNLKNNSQNYNNNGTPQHIIHTQNLTTKTTTTNNYSSLPDSEDESIAKLKETIQNKKIKNNNHIP